MSKPKIIKDYDRLPEAILAEIKLNFPYGFEKHLIQFKNRDGKLVSALPFETDEFNYMVRMTRQEAQDIIKEDDDYNLDGNLTDEAQERLEEISEEDIQVDDED